MMDAQTGGVGTSEVVRCRSYKPCQFVLSVARVSVLPHRLGSGLGLATVTCFRLAFRIMVMVPRAVAIYAGRAVC
jgi:hypothetical protein